ncbi:hypothetical protein ILUMI_27277 [Ignelater luminosus]|uniref:Uncharacterized protein n=1 Tax=Ignelater luminosus TaxID=2038154 RepID=A0A8K0C390_IGNLU|nr:hypothetical protein ILUMI_27277 [Ignelater luminosus]
MKVVSYAQKVKNDIPTNNVEPEQTKMTMDDQHLNVLQLIHGIPIDVLLFSETHLTKQGYLTFRGHNTYHTPHPDNFAHGDSAICKYDFAEYLENCFQLNEADSEHQLSGIVESDDQEVELVSPKEWARETRANLSINMVPGYDLMAGKLIKKLPIKAIVKLTCAWKMIEIIMIQKPENSEEE